MTLRVPTDVGANNLRDWGRKTADAINQTLAKLGAYLPLTGGTLTGDLNVPDEAYGAGWNGSTEVATKNALYDKIETIAGGGTTTNPLTMNDGGAGAAAGTTFDGSVARTISYNTVGAAASSHTHAQADVTGLTTADSPQFTAINLGHASDTTLTRVSAGVVAVEGVNVVTTAGGVTFAADISVPDEAYDATNWNGSVEVPTKNAVRDKIESLSATHRGALVTKAADQTAANYSSNTAIGWDSESYDTDAIHDTVTNNSRLSVPSGVTKVKLLGSLHLTSLTSSDTCTARIGKNGGVDNYTGATSTTSDIAGATRRMNLVSPILTVTGGTDYFELFLVTGGDTSITVEADSSWFAMEIIE